MEERRYRIGPDACWLGHQYEHNKTKILFEGYTPVDDTNAIYLKFNGRKPYLIPMLDLALEVTQPLTEHPGIYECQIEERSADDTLISQSCKFNMYIAKSLKAGAKYEVKDDRLETIYRHYNELYQRLVALDEKFSQVDSVLLLGSANPVENDTLTKEFGKDRTRLTAVEDRATVLEVRANTAETDIDNAEDDIEQLQDKYADMKVDVDYCKKQIDLFDPEGIIVVDKALSATSTNPVENRVVTSALNSKADAYEVSTALATKANASEVTTALAGKVDKVSGKGLSTNDYTDDDKAALANKVDKVTGKGLSTEDYTTAEKTKLAGIATGANNYSLPSATASVLGGVKVNQVGSYTPADNNNYYHIHKITSSDKIVANVPPATASRHGTISGTTYQKIQDVATKSDAIADYIVETGTENGFTYEKRSSGLMKAWGSFELTGSYTWIAWGNIYESSRGVTVTYPTGFVEKPMVISSGTYPTGASSMMGAHLYHYYDDSVEIYAHRPNTVTASTIVFFVELIGRWK